jgi:arsenate reductase (glutaredoxin)
MGAQLLGKGQPDIVLYGIENCDQVRKSRQWLKAQHIDYRFHDFRRDGLGVELLANWLSHVPWDALLNRRGTTWRKLAETDRQRIVDQASAIELMIEMPAVIKRPVLQTRDHLLVGFSEIVFKATLDELQRTGSKPGALKT